MKPGAARKPLPRLLAAAAFLCVLAVPAARAADIFKGKEIYFKYCVVCHGDNGKGVMPGTPNFARRDSLMKPDPILFESIRSGRNAMPSYRGVLTEREILDVVAYLRTFR